MENHQTPAVSSDHKSYSPVWAQDIHNKPNPKTFTATDTSPVAAPKVDPATTNKPTPSIPAETATIPAPEAQALPTPTQTSAEPDSPQPAKVEDKPAEPSPTEVAKDAQNAAAIEPVKNARPNLVAGQNSSELIKKVGIGAVGVVVFAGIIVIATLALAHPITSWEVSAASNSSADFSADVTALSSGVKSLVSAQTTADLSSASASIYSKLWQSNNQYELLSGSPVVKDSIVKGKFAALKAQWLIYYSFVNGTYHDYQTLGPILIGLNGSQQSLMTANRASTADLGSRLSGYSALISKTTTDSASLNMQTAQDKNLVAALQTYLKSSTAAIAQGNTDLASGKGVNAVATDITAITEAATVFSQAEDSFIATASTQARAPVSELNAFNTALNSLSGHASK